MNKFDVAGLLKTYSEQCLRVTSKKRLQELIKELNSEEIKKFSITDED